MSDDLLQQMGTVDYEAVMRDLTLLMTDSQVGKTFSKIYNDYDAEFVFV